MNVAEFIEWLKTQDQEAEVRVLRAIEAGGYYSSKEVSDFPFDPEADDFEVMDWTDNQFVKPEHPHFGKKELILGDVG